MQLLPSYHAAQDTCSKCCPGGSHCSVSFCRSRSVLVVQLKSCYLTLVLSVCCTHYSFSLLYIFPCLSVCPTERSVCSHRFSSLDNTDIYLYIYIYIFIFPLLPMSPCDCLPVFVSLSLPLFPYRIHYCPNLECRLSVSHLKILHVLPDALMKKHSGKK